MLPSELRGTGLAWVVVMGNLVGAGLGPQAVGSVSDLLAAHHIDDSLRIVMLAVTLMSLIPAALFFFATRNADASAEPAALF